ncbi:formylglycine-generating enzyme family protein [Actinoplanes sp. NPDC004185]
MWAAEIVSGRPAWRHTASGVVFREVPGGTFLIARHPLTVEQVRHWLPAYEDDYADTDTTVARIEDGLDELLAALPFRLPSEAEWEYSAHAGTSTLTFRGDARPGEEQLLDDFGDEQRTAAAENPFGLAGIGSATELCADAWFPDSAHAPADARPRTGDGPRTVRGGAADVHPWQGCDEWLLLLSSSRYAQGDFLAIRPVAGVPPR